MIVKFVSLMNQFITIAMDLFEAKYDSIYFMAMQ